MYNSNGRHKEATETSVSLLFADDERVPEPDQIEMHDEAVITHIPLR